MIVSCYSIFIWVLFCNVQVYNRAKPLNLVRTFYTFLLASCSGKSCHKRIYVFDGVKVTLAEKSTSTPIYIVTNTVLIYRNTKLFAIFSLCFFVLVMLRDRLHKSPPIIFSPSTNIVFPTAKEG